MVSNPPDNWPRINPCLLYEDVDAALDWLARAFGFVEKVRMPGPDGSSVHAEMGYRGSVVMLGCPGKQYENPKRHGHTHASLYVYVDDVDAHYAQAKSAGATITEEPADQFYGDRRYTCKDPEGHEWAFATHVRDVPLDQMKPPDA